MNAKRCRETAEQCSPPTSTRLISLAEKLEGMAKSGGASLTPEAAATLHTRR